MDKVNLENILFVNKCINNILPPIFNDWSTFVSTQHTSLTKKNFLNPHLRFSPMVKILLYPALFSHNAQQKLGSIKTLPSAKIKQR